MHRRYPPWCCTCIGYSCAWLVFSLASSPTCIFSTVIMPASNAGYTAARHPSDYQLPDAAAVLQCRPFYSWYLAPLSSLNSLPTSDLTLQLETTQCWMCQTTILSTSIHTRFLVCTTCGPVGYRSKALGTNSLSASNASQPGRSYSKAWPTMPPIWMQCTF